MKKFFEEILFDEDFDELNNMVRWNGMSRIKDESVAHHSFIVTWFTRLMVEEIFEEDAPKLWAITYAMFHDFNEFITGDINHNLKYNDFNGEEIRRVLNDYISHRVKNKFPKTTNSNKMLNECLVSGGIPTYLKKLVKLADWLSMRFYLQKEINLGNRSVIPKRLYCENKIEQSVTECLIHLQQQKVYKVNLTILQ